MPLPTPRTNETRDEFVDRCMGDDQAITDFPDADQRVAVCNRQWDEGKMTEPERKSIAVEIKDEDRGEIEAVFATFNQIDKDGDVTLPGAFEDGAEVVISAYGHSSWMGELPVGKGTIKQTKTDARLRGQFFLDTVGGKEHFNVIKQLGAKQEWSYGFDIKGTGSVDDLPERLRGADRVLTKLRVFEVSPVLVGAGVNTRTERVKGQELTMTDKNGNTWTIGLPTIDAPKRSLPKEEDEDKEEAAKAAEEAERAEAKAALEAEQALIAEEYARLEQTRKKYAP